MRHLLLAAFAALSVSIANSAEPREARLLRFPHRQGDHIAFCYGGDIWTATVNGGVARRITSFDEGVEIFPRISPDGQWIAFSGEYSGTRQIYVVPYEGGIPRQLTFYPDVGPMPPRGGYDNIVLDWTPDGKKILIRSNRTSYGKRIGKYFLVDPFSGGLEQPLQIPEGGPATFSPDGSKLAYNIISREWRTWKRYRAGRAQDVYLYDLERNEIERLTDFEGTDNHPMWLGDRVYFTSDRTGTLNLYAYDLETRDTRAITEFDEFDVLFPARGHGGLIFECGGYLYVMDEDESVRKLSLQLADDRPWLRPSWIDGEGAVASFDISPNGKRVVVDIRGDTFTVPVEKGEPHHLVRTPRRRERDVQWSPDGETIAYLAEAGEDYELFLHDVRTGEERQVTQGSDAWILHHRWAPDSKQIALNDRGQRLSILELATGELRELDRGHEAMIGSVCWSADSNWLAYVKQGENSLRSIWICSADGETAPTQVTSDRFDDRSVAFDPAGRYLYFVSARDFNYQELEFDSRIFALLLDPDAPSPVSFEQDLAAATVPEREIAEDEQESKEESAEPAAEESAEPAAAEGSNETIEEPSSPWKIDLDRLSDRLVVLPMPTGNYANLEAVEGGLLFVEGRSLHRYDLEKREPKEVLAGVTGYELTPDGKKIVYSHGRDLCVAEPTPGQTAGEKAIPLERVRFRIDRNQEWSQIYLDAWRIMRDWFYDPRMHQVDWVAMREKYRPLVDHVAHRDDLDFLLGELIGELNCGHTYVTRGDSPRVERIPVGVLGCELEVGEGERYRIKEIFDGEPWDEATRSPLAEVGVDARVGDYLIAIDDHPITTQDNPYRYLENKVGRTVRLLVNDRPIEIGARELLVKPAASEQGLRYRAWVQRNAEIVDRLSEGRIGYVHVPNTAVAGHRELLEGFRAQALVKEAMIIDDRYNGGGFVPDRMIQAISHPVYNYWARRHSKLSTTPSYAFEGPMAMLINGYSSSGGDAFPYYFRRLGRGPLIGKKTWGGLVGYSGTPSFVDGGGLAVPGFAFVNIDGEWDVEYYGVEPDIEVFDDPTQIQAGREPILERAIEHLLEELKAAPKRQRPPVPAGPDRNGASRG